MGQSGAVAMTGWIRSANVREDSQCMPSELWNAATHPDGSAAVSSLYRW